MFSRDAACLYGLTFVFAAFLGVSSALGAPGTEGAVHGRVLGEGDRPLSGAAVLVRGTSLYALTNEYGEFQIARVPVGSASLEVTHLGYQTATTEVLVSSATTVQRDIRIRPSYRHEEMVTVRGEPILEGQAKALNRQKNAMNIKNVVASDQIGRFPDPNAAEATQRISGITIQRDQGEGRYVLVRGSDPRLSAASINGLRLPSPEGDVRHVALDVVPADLLESIEVSKTLRPDMDGDAIGGDVNLITKRPSSETRMSLTAGLGYNDISGGDLQTANASFARSLVDDRLAVSVATSYHDTDRGADGFEVEYDDGSLDNLELLDYNVNRKRFGLVTDLDFRPSESSEFFLRTIYNRYSDQEYRRRSRSRLDKDRLERELKDRLEVQRIASFSAGGLHSLPSSFQLDYEVAYAYADEDEPQRHDTTFRQKKVDFAPNVGPESIDPNNIQSNPANEDLADFTFDDLKVENNFTRDRELSVKLDLLRPFVGSTDWSGLWKVGTKVRARTKRRDNTAVVYESDEDFFLADFVDRSYDPGNFLEGRYQLDEFIAPGPARSLIETFGLEGAVDLEEDLADYSAEEDTVAFYGLTELSVGSRLRLLGGARYERVDVSYESRELLLDEEGDISDVGSVTGTNDYAELLPMFHVVVQVDEDTNLRAAATRSFARPNYVDVVPFQLLNREDLELERGNPNLEATKAWNFDVLGERYFSTVGVVSGGFFYKSLSDTIFISRFDEERDSGTFQVTQPVNADHGSIMGLELAYQNVLRFLPSPIDGLGVFANATLTSSSAELPGRSGADNALPGQAAKVANMSVFYEKYGFSGRLSLNYHDAYLLQVGSSPRRDVFVDRHVQLDFSASQRITPKMRLFVELINLNNEAWRLYEGSPDRPIVEEYYSWWGTFGIKWDF